jgi:hypothetical protein
MAQKYTKRTGLGLVLTGARPRAARKFLDSALAVDA